MLVERKFLLNDSSILDDVLNKNYKKHRIHKFYTSFSPEFCYVKDGENYILKHKKQDALQINFSEFKIDKDEFKEAQKDAICDSLDKICYDFSIANRNFCLEIYEKNLINLVILKAQFNNQIEANNFKFNEIFPNQNFNEITDDERYESKNLSIFGLVKADYDTQKASEIYARLPDLKFIVPGYLDSFDLTMTILRTIFCKIKILKIKFLDDKKDATFDEIRRLFQKSVVILTSFNNLFNKNFLNQIIDPLNEIIVKTEQKNDINLLIKNIEKLDYPSSFLKKLNLINEKCNDKICKLLTGEKFELFCENYEIFLSSKDRFFATKEYEKISKKQMANLLFRSLKKLKKMMKKIDENSKNEFLLKFHKKVKKFLYLHEYFATSFDAKNLDKFAKFAMKTEKNLNCLQDIFVIQNFIAIYAKSSDKQIDESRFLSSLSANLISQHNELREKILQQNGDLKKFAKKSMQILKPYL